MLYYHYVAFGDGSSYIFRVSVDYMWPSQPSGSIQTHHFWLGQEGDAE